MEQCRLGRAGVSTVEILRRGQSCPAAIWRSSAGQGVCRKPGPLSAPSAALCLEPPAHLSLTCHGQHGLACRRGRPHGGWEKGQVGEQVLGGLKEGR